MAVGTPAHGPDSALKARERRGTGAWQPRGDGALTGGPGAKVAADKWAPLVSVFRIKFTPGQK
jgi:hypothetical protein